MNKLTRISATVVSSLALVAGFSGVAGASSVNYSDTGRGSTNVVRWDNRSRTTVDNQTNVDISNRNPQNAWSGQASATDNDDTEQVQSGDAYNDSWVQANVEVDNSSSTSAATSGGSGSGSNGSDANVSLTDTGRDSYNKVSFENSMSTKVMNNTDVNITNNNSQEATSGAATAENNDDVGTVRSGNVSNTSTAAFSVSVKN